MSTLQSKLFTQCEQRIATLLENCANGTPNEVVSHFAAGGANSQGDHILRIQKALALIRSREPSLQIPNFVENGIYDATFARAIVKYKTGRGILNFARQIDPVVGKGTIRALDRDVQAIEMATPTPPPNPSPTPQPQPQPQPHNDPSNTAGEFRRLKVGSWNRSTSESFQGGQGIKFVLRNLSPLGASIKITDTSGKQAKSQIILPLSTAEFEFSAFGIEPKSWNFNVDTDSDAFLITYEVWSTWIPGDPINR